LKIPVQQLAGGDGADEHAAADRCMHFNQNLEVQVQSFGLNTKNKGRNTRQKEKEK
jgi:hypothetical protein